LGVADYVLCRKDGVYSDSRHPDSVEIGTIYHDLARRDFTVNAMARNLVTDTIIDPHDGMEDLANRVLRCVGKTHDRFSEDALRILRALRFSITKEFELDDEIIASFQDHKLVAQLRTISIERVREELYRMFKASTIQSLMILSDYPYIRNAIFAATTGVSGGVPLWLEPTLKDR
jgi:tRNA nucleotidyltransferase (CCA-adding enzyme)